MSNGDQENRSKISRSLSKDRADATESNPSNGVEGSIDPISNPVNVNINMVAVAPHKTDTAVGTSDVKNQDATRVDMVI